MKNTTVTVISICLLGCIIVAAAVLALPDTTAYAAPPVLGGLRLENLLRLVEVEVACFPARMQRGGSIGFDRAAA